MPWFNCLIHGENFVMDWQGELKSLGFFVNRIVQAEDHDHAEKVGLKLLRVEKSLNDDEVKQRSPLAKITFEEVHEIESPIEDFVQPGLIFYNPEDGD